MIARSNSLRKRFCGYVKVTSRLLSIYMCVCVLRRLLAQGTGYQLGQTGAEVHQRRRSVSVPNVRGTVAPRKGTVSHAAFSRMYSTRDSICATSGWRVRATVPPFASHRIKRIKICAAVKTGVSFRASNFSSLIFFFHSIGWLDGLMGSSLLPVLL